MILSCKPKNGRVGVNNKYVKMNKFKLLGVTAVLGLSMLFSTPARAEKIRECYAGEWMEKTVISIFGIVLYESINHLTGEPC